jgi:mannonate dehydratase
MKNDRRNFIKKSASLAASVSLAGISTGLAGTSNHRTKESAFKNIAGVAKDGGMEFSISLFGFDSPRIALAKQMGIYGAVAGVSGNDELKPWDPKAITTVKEQWEKLGMKWNVVEGPPTLGEKTKLGLEGRDEEIANFITFMKNLKQYGGVYIISYNWMKVVSWFRTSRDTV